MATLVCRIGTAFHQRRDFRLYDFGRISKSAFGILKFQSNRV